jgi:hypothetical protein
MLRCINDGVTTIKPGRKTTGDASVMWSDELSTMLFPASGRVYIGEHPRKPTIWNAWFQQ